MATSYTMVPVRPDVHERLLAVRARVSEMFRSNEGSLGLSPMLVVLLEHFENAPPDLDWLRAVVEAQPRRGRPRRSKPVTKVDEWGKEVVVQPRRGPSAQGRLEHRWTSPKANPDLSVCMRCDDFRPEGRGSTHCKPMDKPWTKKQLLPFGFTAEELAWAPDE